MKRQVLVEVDVTDDEAYSTMLDEISGLAFIRGAKSGGKVSKVISCALMLDIQKKNKIN